MPRALIALGTNLGDRSAMLARAAERLQELAAGGDLRVSRTFETSPAGGPTGQDSFLNAAIALETQLAPHDLLTALRAIEDEFGRVRAQRWGSRLIDLDILLYDDAQGEPLVVADADLQIPHPRMSFRRFVLDPAAEVAPEMIHAVAGLNVAQLLAHLNSSRRYVALCGGTAKRRNELVQAVVAATGAADILDPRESGRAARANGSSGPATKARLQFLDETTELLAHRDWQPRQWVVSAFVAPELAVALSLAVTEDDAAIQSEAFQVAQRADALIPEPRLLVLLDDWTALVAAHHGVVFEEDRERQAGLTLASVGKLPVLCAGRGDFESQLTEITAALVAME